MTGWLDALARHSVFEHAQAETSTGPGDELPRPESPNLSLSAVFDGRNGAAKPQRPAKKGSKGQYVEKGPKRRKKLLCVARGTDLIVATGSQLRIVNLADVKARYDGQSRSDDPSDLARTALSLGEYKTLDTPAIKFEIQQLVINQTSKLLAVLGVHSVALVVLPRKGWSKSIGHEIQSKSLLVGSFYHCLPGSPRVCQASWHPLAQSSASLVVLTADGALREYQVTEDTEEPAQTVHFVSRHEKQNANSTFSGVDTDAREAVAFCFGSGAADWGPLTVYGLMRSGDLYAICPFLPKKARLPTQYLHSLSAYTAVEASLEQKALLSSSSSTAIPTNMPARIKYIEDLLRCAKSETDGEEPSEFVTVNIPPALRHRTGARQGPFLMQPSPVELDTGADSYACDLAYVAKDSCSALVVAYTDGKVDILLETDKVEPSWTSPSAFVEQPALPALMTYETIELGFEAALDSNKQSVDLLDDSEWPVLTQDPLYADTLYLHHALGAHCLTLSWLDDVDAAVNDARDAPQDLSRLTKNPQSTGVVWVVKTMAVTGAYEEAPPVVACQVINDVYLGYSLLLMTASRQLVGIELALRVDPRLLPSEEAFSPTKMKGKGVSDEPPAYLSLLEERFKVPALFTKPPVATRLALQPPANSQSKGELVINADSLRFMGKTVETFRHEIRELVEAADQVQNRLELQLRELSRQLSKLRDLSDLTNELRTSTVGSSGAANRFERVESAQVELIRRTDRVLQRLMDAHAPELSVYEKRWFAELARLEKEVRGGIDGAGGQSLELRSERLQAQFEALRPALEAMRQRAPSAPDSPGRVGTQLGSQQLSLIETRLATEARMIADAKRKLESITAAVAAL